MTRHAEMTRYRVTAGRSAIFPMDMARFAMSWPWASDDAVAIERSIRGEVEARQFINLACPHRADGCEFMGLVRRWNSFGWRVEIECDVRGWVSPDPFGVS